MNAGVNPHDFLVPVSADLLSIARQREGLSQKALADAAGVTQAFISRLEAGNYGGVASDIVAKIALALNVAPGFFSRRFDVRHLGFHRLYRLQRKIGAKAMAQLEADLNARRLHLLALLRTLDLSPSLPYPDATRFESLKPREAARELRRFWSIRSGPIPHLTSMLEAAGIVIVEVPSLDGAFGGLAVHAYGALPIIFVAANQPDDRRRLTLAHELGHLLLHTQPTDDSEAEAFAFASELLLPREDALRLLNPFSLRAAFAVKQSYRISVRSLVMTAKELGIIDADRARRFHKEIVSRGWAKEEPYAKEAERPALLGNLLSALRQDLNYSLEDIAAMFHESTERVAGYYFPEARKAPSLRVL